MTSREIAIATLDTDIFDAATSPTGRRRGLLPGEVEQGLDEAGTRLHVARRLAANAAADLADWARAAQDTGMEIKETARLAGVSRQTIYDWAGK